jgi:hypothetical protein
MPVFIELILFSFSLRQQPKKRVIDNAIVYIQGLVKLVQVCGFNIFFLE